MSVPKVQFATKSRLLGRGYTLGIVSAAVFLLGLVIWRPPLGRTTAEAILQQPVEPQSPSEMWPAAVVGEVPVPKDVAAGLKSPELAGAVLESIEPTLVASDLELSTAADPQEVLTQRVGLRARLSPDKKQLLIGVSFSSNSEELALQVTDLLAESFARSFQPQSSRQRTIRWQEAEQRVRDAEQALQSAEQNTAQFVREGVEQCRREFLAQSSQSQPAAGVDGPPPVAVTRSVNPKWQAISDEVQVAVQRRMVLLERLTTQHPQVLQLDAEISNLRDVLQSIPKMVDESPAVAGTADMPDPFGELETETPNAPAIAAGTSGNGRGEASRLGQAERVESEFDAEVARRELVRSEPYLALSAIAEEARSRHRQAVEALAKLPRPDSPGDVGVTLLREAQPATTSRASWGLLRLLSLAAVAALAGFTCFVCSGRTVLPPVLFSVNDVSETLGLPVIGAIATRDGPPLPEPDVSGPTRSIRLATRAAELLVTAALLAVLYASLTKHGFGDQLLRHPFSAYTQAVDEVGASALKLVRST